MNTSAPILELQQVSAGYQGRLVLREVTVAIRPGESVALIGPNGCGKSTLFRVAMGVRPAETGRVLFNGQETGRTNTDMRVRGGMGYLTQSRNVFAGLSVEGNLTLAAESVDGNDTDARIAQVMAVLPILKDCRSKRAGLLSGGERQSLAVAMVLMRPPKVLLLDEPVAGLSPATATGLLEGLEALRQKEGFATVVVEHRLRQVQPFVSRVLVMREGRIVDDTTETERMLDAAWLAGHYLNGKKGA